MRQSASLQVLLMSPRRLPPEGFRAWGLASTVRHKRPLRHVCRVAEGTVTPAVVAAIVAGATSLILALVNVLLALRQATLTRELETVKAKLNRQASENQALLDYQYEARRRLYTELQPHFFQLGELGDSAYTRIAGLAATAANGDLGDRGYWLYSGLGGNLRGAVNAESLGDRQDVRGRLRGDRDSSPSSGRVCPRSATADAGRHASLHQTRGGSRLPTAWRRHPRRPTRPHGGAGSVSDLFRRNLQEDCPKGVHSCPRGLCGQLQRGRTGITVR